MIFNHSWLMRLEAKRYLFRTHHLECSSPTWRCSESIHPYKSVLGSNGTEGITPTTSILESSLGLVLTSPCTSLLHLQLQVLVFLTKTYKSERSGFRKINPDPGCFETINTSANIDSRWFNYQLTFTNNHKTINNLPNYLLFARYISIFSPFWKQFSNHTLLME